jgi:hypothetical protein
VQFQFRANFFFLNFIKFKKSYQLVRLCAQIVQDAIFLSVIFRVFLLEIILKYVESETLGACIQ